MLRLTRANCAPNTHGPLDNFDRPRWTKTALDRREGECAARLTRRRPRRNLPIAVALVLFSIGLLGATETAHADDSNSTDPRYAVSPESISERLAVAQQELEAIDSDERQENLEHRLEDRAALAALTTLLTRQLEIAGQLEAPLEPAAESDLGSEPPSVFALGAVEAERRRRQDRAAQLRDELGDAQESLDSARRAAREAGAC